MEGISLVEIEYVSEFPLRDLKWGEYPRVFQPAGLRMTPMGFLCPHYGHRIHIHEDEMQQGRNEALIAMAQASQKELFLSVDCTKLTPKPPPPQKK